MARIFLAIPVPESYRESIGHYASALPSAEIRWVQPETYHLTVVFFGEQENALLPSVYSAIEAVAENVKPFALTFDAISYAPPLKKPTMIWAQYKSTETFTTLVRSVETGVQNVLVFDDKRAGHEPIPHITMARLRMNQVPTLPQIELDTLKVTELNLYESYRTEQGRAYRILQSFRLE